MSKAYFGDIRTKIGDEIEAAEHSLQIAMAWFTNPVLYKYVLDKAAAGKKVELLLSDSESNFKSGKSLDFESLIRKGAKVYISLSDEGLFFMHHKFVVIDGKKLITGSYNWSNNAQTNFENVLIVDDEKVANIYSLQFKEFEKRDTTISYQEFMAKNVIPQSNQEAEEADSSLFDLAQKFNRAVDDAMQEAESLNLGLRMSIINGMIKRYTAVGAARKLSNDDEQSGFLKLVAEHKAHLTFEYLTAKSEFSRLFDKSTVKNAKKKLRPYIGDEVDRL